MKVGEGKIEWWGKRLILSLLLFPAAGFLLTFSADQVHREYAERSAQTRSEAAQQRITKECIRRREPRLVAQCAAQAPQSGPETERREREVYAQEATARWARAAVFIAVVGLFFSVFGILALYRTITQGQRTYEAFVSVEDAALVVDYPGEGGLIESIEEGVRQPDTYFFRAAITNIGRSTARIESWFDGTHSQRVDYSLKRDETWQMSENREIAVQEPEFTLSIYYSSPLRERMVLEVRSVISFTQAAFGGGRHLYARVKSTRVRPAAQRQPE